MLVRLTRKLAEYLDGVDLSYRSVNEIFDLPSREAELLIAEGWATHVTERPPKRRRSTAKRVPPEAGDTGRSVRVGSE